MGTLWTRAAAAAVLLIMSAFGVVSGRAEEIVSLPNLSYRTGPFASTGIPLMNGQRDYMMMINERDGGINGVRLGYEECETGYSTEKGVECYERTKATALLAQPGSPGLTLELLARSNTDRIPILAPGYGFSPMSDGKVFKWAFNPPLTHWDGASMILSYLSDGNLERLRSKKIVLLHLDSPYGSEPIPFLQSFAERHGFKLLPVPVGIREMQNQSAQWRQIQSQNPDYVLLWGWSTMNAGALTEAVKIGFPMEKLIGIWWSGNDGDMKSVGEAGRGYRVLSWNIPVSDAPAMLDIRKYVLDPKKTEIEEGQFDWVFYQRGVLISMFTVEAIRTAQEHFNTRLIDASELRWGFENLDIDDERLARIGMTGMIAPFATSCANHSGHGGAWMLEWDGGQFVPASGLLHADRAAVNSLVMTEADKYAEAHSPWAMNDGCN